MNRFRILQIHIAVSGTVEGLSLVEALHGIIDLQQERVLALPQDALRDLQSARLPRADAEICPVQRDPYNIRQLQAGEIQGIR